MNYLNLTVLNSFLDFFFWEVFQRNLYNFLVNFTNSYFFNFIFL